MSSQLLCSAQHTIPLIRILRQNMVLGQTSERQTSEWTNVRVETSEWQTSEKTKRQRRQTSEWDKHQRNLDFCQTLTFYSSLRTMLIILFCWTKTVLKKISGQQGHFLFFFITF